MGNRDEAGFARVDASNIFLNEFGFVTSRGDPCRSVNENWHGSFNKPFGRQRGERFTQSRKGDTTYRLEAMPRLNSLQSALKKSRTLTVAIHVNSTRNIEVFDRGRTD